MNRPALLRSRAAVLALLTLLVAFPASAQEPQLATITAMLDLRHGEQGELIRGPTDRVRVTRGGSPDWLLAQPRMALFRFDRVLVEPRTVARLALRAGDARGQAHLVGDLETRDATFAVDDFGELGRGIYEIQEVPRELGDLQLYVAQGSLALNWVRGRLVGFAGGIRWVVSGTRVVVVADEAGEQALLQLIEGEVTFPDHEEVRLAPGEVAQLRPGLPPVVLPAGAAALQMIEAAQWSTRGAWPRPWYTRPWVWAGAGAGALVVGQLVRSALGNGGPDTRSGTVILEIPF